MINSIRNFLLINLLAILWITTSLLGLGNYYLGYQDIQNHLDNLLSQAALSFEAMLSEDDLLPQNLRNIQISLDTIPTRVQHLLTQRQTAIKNIYQDKYQFQAWDTQGHLILHSANAPTTLLGTGRLGFSNLTINNELWRVFTTYHPQLQLKLIVAERYNLRNHLMHTIARDDIIIMTITFLLSGLLVWFVVGRGLRTLNQVAQEVAHREYDHLEPVSLNSIPLEIKPLIIELNKLFLRLQQAFEKEQRFAADAAHEMRTPLAALKTQTQLALKTTDPEERQVLLKNLLKSVDRSTHIVQQLLTLSRLEHTAPVLQEYSRINLEKVSTEIIAQLIPLALEKNITIEFFAAKRRRFHIYGDATAIGILFRNLIDNAIRYTPAQGHILITLDKEADAVVWKIADNGPGIPVELRSRVFERFFRVLGSKSPGSGLGLAIVQQIANLHHAQVKLGSPLSATGLEVEVRFPIRPLA
jgi:two-component system sensor histidine kinase QseC